MISRTVYLLLMAGIVSQPASANEDGIYESLGRIPIGRVFLTPGEREQLDQLRSDGPPRSPSPKPRRQPAADAVKPDAAGFIISDSGKTRVWKDGDFVIADSVANVRFPHRVRVSSQPAAKRGDPSPTDNESGTSPAESGDDEE